MSAKAEPATVKNFQQKKTEVKYQPFSQPAKAADGKILLDEDFSLLM